MMKISRATIDIVGEENILKSFDILIDCIHDLDTQSVPSSVGIVYDFIIAQNNEIWIYNMLKFSSDGYIDIISKSSVPRNCYTYKIALTQKLVDIYEFLTL